MTYNINNTIGELLAQVADSAIDQTTTDITFIGKNVSGYGEYINENFVKLLENFASSTQPNKYGMILPTVDLKFIMAQDLV